MLLRGDYETQDPRLDRVPSQTDEHIRKYPLRTSDIAQLAEPVPMAIGINWYANFDRPVKDSAGHWWVGNGSLGSIRGGHCVCLKGRGMRDYLSWWSYYDQRLEGRCVQFGVSRMQTLLNRKRYEIREAVPPGRWLYYEAQRNDEWDGGSYPGASPQYEGTSVNAGLWVIKNKGIIPYGLVGPSRSDGIGTFRWARDYNDVKTVLGYADRNYVDVLNSWGTSYPHLVRMTDAAASRLFAEDGEFGVVTDWV